MALGGCRQTRVQAIGQVFQRERFRHAFSLKLGRRSGTVLVPGLDRRSLPLTGGGELRVLARHRHLG